MPVFQLAEHSYHFPDPNQAEPTGLIAVGGDFHPERLLTAYSMGIFPWFEHENTLFWFCPDPRAVLFPSELAIHKSMRSIFNQKKFFYSFDTAFEAVIQACSDTPRNQDDGTWITKAFIDGYTNLYHIGYAHSVEVRNEQNDLVGGLYGIAIGRVFYGESMFSLMPNASKAGFITLVRALQKAGFSMIDCQQETQHLLSLGARTIPRIDFLRILKENNNTADNPGKWILQEDNSLKILPVFS